MKDGIVRGTARGGIKREGGREERVERWMEDEGGEAVNGMAV